MSAALIAGIIYACTMFPGLAGIGDTPKFQFVGSLLGTPHSPGYPVYMLLTWLFSHLPFGTLAFRMNLVSVLAGAAAVGLFCAVLVELECRPILAALGALAIGLGRVFWSQALLAEVYTVNAALFAGALLFVLRWARTRRDADLLTAGVFVALGGAHHLTLVMTVPAIILFVLATDMRRVLRPGLVAKLLLIAAAAASLYGLIWLRTTQHAGYLEVRAHSVGDVIAIVSGRQFADHLLSLKAERLLEDRGLLLAWWLAGELRRLRVLFFVVGLVVLARQRRRHALLLLGGAAGVLAFALDYDVYDLEVFLILPMIAFGMVAAIGIERLARIRLGRWPRLAPVLSAAMMVAFVIKEGEANWQVNDQHRHDFEAQYFDALFRQLPARTAFVEESYPIDHMLLYKILGERAGGSRHVVLIPASREEVLRYRQDGFTVYAFTEGRRKLTTDGLDLDDAKELALPKPRPRHILDTEAQVLAFPLSRLDEAAARRASNDASGPDTTHH